MKLYLVDCYSNYKEYTPVDKNNPLSWEKEAHKLNKKGNEIWIRKTSKEAFKDIKEKIDFCYIDANHAYEYVLEDLNNYWKLINKGGILVGHDINQEEVSKAVMEFAQKNKLRIYFGDRRDWWIIKN